MTTLSDKVRENRARRALRRHECRLFKSRCRTPIDPGYGGYMIVDFNNIVVDGATHHAFSCSLDDVEAFIEMQSA